MEKQQEIIGDQIQTYDCEIKLFNDKLHAFDREDTENTTREKEIISRHFSGRKHKRTIYFECE